MIHWNELTKIGKSNQAYRLAHIMFDNNNECNITGWDKKVTFFYLDSKYHLEPKPFGMKLSIDKPLNNITIDDLFYAILNY